MQGFGAVSCGGGEASPKRGPEVQVTLHRVVLPDGRAPKIPRELSFSTQGHPCGTVSRIPLSASHKYKPSCARLHVGKTWLWTSLDCSPSTGHTCHSLRQGTSWLWVPEHAALPTQRHAIQGRPMMCHCCSDFKGLSQGHKAVRERTAPG